jgi:hypothetical protein
MKWLRACSPASLAIGLSLAVVASTTGFVSYTHISALTVALGQSWKTAHLTPLFIDGQIVIGSVIYMVLPDRKRFFGLLGVVPGVLESLFANWESSTVHGSVFHVYEAHAWATVAAQAFAVSSFLFERWLKEQAGQRAAAGESAGEPGITFRSPVPADSQSAAEIALRATLAAGNPLSGRQLETRFGLSRAQSTKVRELVLAGSNGHLAADGSEDADQ